MKLTIWLAALVAVAAPAQAQVALQSHIAVERSVTDASGKTKVTLEEPKKVVPGDRLLFTIHYANSTAKPAENFVVTNPIPAEVSFAGNESPGAEVSVDGGKSFGALASLKVADADGKSRAAAAADVTHVRWSFAKAIPASASGDLKFNAIVK